MVDEAIEFIKKHKLNSASSISAALKGLLEKDFITNEGGAYRIYDKFLELWIRRQMATN